MHLLARLRNSENCKGYGLNIELGTAVAVCLNTVDLLRCSGSWQCRVFVRFRSSNCELKSLPQPRYHVRFFVA